MIENTVCMVVRKEGKILLVKRGNMVFRGWWAVPGGHAEKGEKIAEAAQREANEEIGRVEVEEKPFLVFVHDWPSDNHTREPHKHRAHAFRARITGALKAGSDAAELGWFTPQEARELKLTGYTITILNHLFK
jgi:8-oxo-dGTP diphosphatase